MVREYLAEAAHADPPQAGCHRGLFQLFAKVVLRDQVGPAASATTALISKTTQVLALVFAHVAISWNVHAVGSPAAGVLVLAKADHLAFRANVKMVIHDVASELAAVV